MVDVDKCANCGCARSRHCGGCPGPDCICGYEPCSKCGPENCSGYVAIGSVELQPLYMVKLDIPTRPEEAMLVLPGLYSTPREAEFRAFEKGLMPDDYTIVTLQNPYDFLKFVQQRTL